MVTRQQVIDNLLNNPVYFNKPIFQKKNGKLYSDMRNFLEIYSILMGTFNKRDDFVWDRGLKAANLLKMEKQNFWGNITEDRYHNIINVTFFINESDLEKFVDSIIMPSLVLASK